MGVGITHMNVKFLRQACWEASRMHLQDVREHMEGASDRDLCSLGGMRSVAVSATAMTLLSRYEANDETVVAAMNSVIERGGPIEATELAGDLYQASAIHASAVLSLAGDARDGSFLPGELGDDLARAMAAAIDERRGGEACGRFELGVGSRAESWTDWGQWAVGFATPGTVAEVARERGFKPDRSQCVQVAHNAADNILCNPFGSTQDLINDQIAVELDNLLGAPAEALEQDGPAHEAGEVVK